MPTAELEEFTSLIGFTLKMSSHQSSNSSCQLLENHKVSEHDHILSTNKVCLSDELMDFKIYIDLSTV